MSDGGGARRRLTLDAVHVDDENPGKARYRGVDVARHAEVADHQLFGLLTVGKAAMHVGERDDGPHRAGAADDDVGIGEHRRQVVEREGVGVDAELADLLGEQFRARQRPVHDVDTLDTRP